MFFPAYFKGVKLILLICLFLKKMALIRQEDRAWLEINKALILTVQTIWNDIVWKIFNRNPEALLVFLLNVWEYYTNTRFLGIFTMDSYFTFSEQFRHLFSLSFR